MIASLDQEDCSHCYVRVKLSSLKTKHAVGWRVEFFVTHEGKSDGSYHVDKLISESRARNMFMVTVPQFRRLAAKPR